LPFIVIVELDVVLINSGCNTYYYANNKCMVKKQ